MIVIPSQASVRAALTLPPGGRAVVVPGHGVDPTPFSKALASHPDSLVFLLGPHPFLTDGNSLSGPHSNIFLYPYGLRSFHAHMAGAYSHNPDPNHFARVFLLGAADPSLLVWAAALLDPGKGILHALTPEALPSGAMEALGLSDDTRKVPTTHLSDSLQGPFAGRQYVLWTQATPGDPRRSVA